MIYAASRSNGIQVRSIIASCLRCYFGSISPCNFAGLVHTDKSISKESKSNNNVNHLHAASHYFTNNPLLFKYILTLIFLEAHNQLFDLLRQLIKHIQL